MVIIDGEQFPDSAQAEELLDILEHPLAHIDIYFEIERMGHQALDRDWKQNMNPYYDDTVLEGSFRRTWNETTSTIQNRETFIPWKAWSNGYKDRQVDVNIEACSDQKLRW